MSLQALILDVDGTLAETADVKRAAFNQAFAEFGLDWVWGRAAFGQIIANALPGAEVEFFAMLRYPSRFAELESEGVLERLPARQQRIYLDLLEAGAASLRPGIARLMGEFAESRLKLAVVSAGPREEFETLLFNRFGLEMLDRLDCAIGAADLPAASAIAAYRECMHRLGVPSAGIVAIDDSGPGVAAAAGLGMSVIATPGYYSRNQNFAGARAVLSDLGHPAAPFAVLAGSAPGSGYVSLAALERWHGVAQTPSVSAA